MNKAAGYLFTLLMALLMVAAVAPSLIALSNALVPLVIVLAVAVVIVRLVFFHTRGW